jgi:hypothetical protein
VLETGTGVLRSVETEDQGEVIGLVAGRLVTYSACRGLPCPIQSVNIVSGETATLSEAAGLARLVEAPAGARLLHETGSDVGQALVLVDPASSVPAPIPGGASAWRVVPEQARAGGALSMPPDWALVSPDGRAATPGGPVELLSLTDGTTLSLTQVTQ